MTERSTVLSTWRHFFADLFLGTFFKIILFTGGGLFLGFATSLLLNSVYISPSEINRWVQYLLFLLAIAWYLSFGVFHSLLACALAVAGKKLKEAVSGLHDLLDLLTTGVMDSYPHFDKQIPRKELEEKFEKMGQKFLEDLKLKGGPLNFIKRIIFQGILKALKFFFLNDILEEIRKKGKEEVSRADMESAVRRVGVEFMLSPITDNFLILHGLNTLFLMLTFGIPYFLFWIF